MSEVSNGDTAGDGPANAGRPKHPLRARAERSRRNVAAVEEAFEERLRILREQHEAWKKEALAECDIQDLEARAAEERQRRDEAQNGPAEGDAQEVITRRPTQDAYKGAPDVGDVYPNLVPANLG